MNIQIKKSELDVQITVLTNIVKMMTARKWLAETDLNKNISKLISKQSDQMTYTVKLSGSGQVVIKIIPQKITAINKTYGIIDFLNEHKDSHKILVVHEISKKAKQIVNKNHPNTEVFLEQELMINLIDHEYVPEHIPLTDEQQKEVLEKYHLKKKNMPKILKADPVSRYYNMKAGNVFKIIRPCEKSGISYCYRLVVKS